MMNRRELMQGIILSAIATRDTRTLHATPLRTKVTSYPRLYLNQARLAFLRRRFRSDPVWAKELRDHGDKMLQESFIPEAVAEQGGGQQAHYGMPAHQVASMAVTLGLLFQLTKEERYAHRLWDAMQFYGTYQRWGGPGLADRNPPWHSELDTSQFCFGYAAAFDAIYPSLTAEQSRQFRDTVIRLGVLPTLNDWILPGKRFHSLDSMGHNWWGVCVSGAGVAALALLGEEQQAQEWIATIDDGFVEWFSYAGNVLHNRIETFEPPNGPSYEGVNYTGYGITSFLRYLLAWQSVFPGRVHPAQRFLSGLPEFFLHTLYPAAAGSMPVNFDDTRENSTAADCILLLHACGITSEYSRRYLRYARGEMEDPLPLYVSDNLGKQTESRLPLSKVYPGMGWALMRTSWDPDSTLLAVKSGFTWNHAHADAGTFLLLHKGSPLIIDSGTCNYGRREYSTYYRQSLAHNVLLFDGQGQPKDQIDIGNKFRGAIVRWFDGLDLRYILADATGPMANRATRHYRHFLWIGNIILILDDVATFEDLRLDWLLHTAGRTSTTGDGSLYVENAKADLLVRPVYPLKAPLEKREGLAPGNPDQKTTYHSFVYQTESGRQRIVMALDLEPSQPTEITTRSSDQHIEITLKTPDEVHRVYINLRSIDGTYSLSSAVSFGEWTSDAYLLVLSSPRLNPEGKVARYFLQDGSFLRRNDVSIFESLSKASCLWRPSIPELWSQGQPHQSLSVAFDRRFHSVRWNGTPAQPDFPALTGLHRFRSLGTNE